MAQTEQLPGLCWACKWAMGKLKKLVSSKSTQSEIREMLTHVCDEIGFLKYLSTTVLSTVLPGMLRRRPTLSVSDSEKRQRKRNKRVLILGSDLPRISEPTK
ncbi:unnamed protein product [Leuciscus chuanchicus]